MLLNGGDFIFAGTYVLRQERLLQVILWFGFRSTSLWSREALGGLVADKHQSEHAGM